jgi:hypothetical protein
MILIKKPSPLRYEVGLSFGYAELAFGSVPDSFSLVPFFWRDKRKGHNLKKERGCPF